MAQISIINKSETEKISRLGAEFFHPEKLLSIAKLQSIDFCYLNDCFSFKKKNVKPSFLEVDNARVFNLTDASSGLMIGEGNLIRNYSDLGSSKKEFKASDVLISKLRPYLKEVCLATNRAATMLCSTEFLVLRQKGDLMPECLLAFLLTKEAQSVLYWSQEGTNHPRFPEFVLKELPVPIFGKELQKAIADKVNLAISNIGTSQKIYDQALQNVLGEIGFSEIDLLKKPFYSVDNNEIFVAGRMDAEHFQPKYKKMINHLEKKGFTKFLGDIVKEPIRRGVQPHYVEDGEVVALNSRYIGPQFIDVDHSERTDNNFWNKNKRGQVKHLDIVMNSTGWGTIGRTNCVIHEQKTIVDNHISIIRPDASTCNPLYLAVYLNTIVGLLQTNKWLTGSSGQVEIYPSAISKFVIYLPSMSFQEKIANLVQEAFQARKEARDLLAQAINKIEDLIDQENK